MSSTKLGQVAAGAASVIEAAAITSRGNALKVYDYEPRDLDVLPAVTIDGPTDFTRRGVDEPESQLGSFDWRLTYTLRIYVAADDPKVASDDSRAILGQVIAAIDADQSLAGTAEIDAVLSDGSREFTADDNQSRTLLVFTCALQVWALA